jgi:hypothetical protein
MSVGTDELFRHITNNVPDKPRLREMLGVPEHECVVKVRPFRLSIMTYNTALLSALYKGTDRDGVVSQIVLELRADPPDIVGLCEVFKNGEREYIRERVSDLLPFTAEGPGLSILNPGEDAGLLLLSRFPIHAMDSIEFDSCQGTDCFANKGCLHVRLFHFEAVLDVDVYFTHTQDLDAIEVPLLLPKAKDALYSQLLQMGIFAELTGAPQRIRFFIGDLNVPGENAVMTAEAWERLNSPVDLWVANGNLPSQGATNVKNNNFGNSPDKDQRLDYILMRRGTQLIPIAKSIQLVKWKRDGKDISDHFGLIARFEEAVELAL